MELETAHSSIVMLGDEIVVGKFDVSSHADALGSIDHSRTVSMPVYANYVFQNSPFQVQVQPQNLQIDYRAPDIFPTRLLDIAREAASVFTDEGIRAIGINLDLIIDPENLGMTGVEFCRENFLAAQDKWQEILGSDEDFSNAGRVTYLKDGIQYAIRFEPHYKSDKNKLFLDFNAHQAIEPPVTHSNALNKYDAVKSYILNILENILVEKQ